MKTKLLFILFVCTACFLNSQVRIKGVVKDSIDVIPDVNIINLNTKIGTNSNLDGEFQLLVRLGDSIQFTSIQHKKAIFYIAAITLKEKFLNVRLQQKTYALDEFELKKHNLSGFLGVDLNAIPEDNTPNVSAISLGLPNAGNRKMTSIERKLYTATTGNGLVPVDLLINVISGRLKKLKEQARIIGEDNDVEYMYKNYRFFVQDYYKIPEKDMYRFLYFCIEDPTYRKSLLKNEMKIIAFFKSRAALFLQETNK